MLNANKKQAQNEQAKTSRGHVHFSFTWSLPKGKHSCYRQSFFSHSMLTIKIFQVSILSLKMDSMPKKYH